MQVRIEHIDDVLPHIVPDRGIIVSRRADHSVIDYVFSTDDTFDSAMALQCRGLKFDAEGRIIARPFHKFFNLGEREPVEAVDWSQAHVVLDKLDGSMIHPAMLNGELVFMTRMGVTDQARAAAAHAGPEVIDLSRRLLEAGKTPLFEYTGPDNRIVVAYERPSLTLLAVRETVEGRYLTHDELADLAACHGVPLVDDLGEVEDPKAFIAEGRALEGLEGYVVAFDDGHRLKLKADAYSLRHKALSGVAYEKNVLAWVVEDAVDDVVPLLAPEIAERVVAYQGRVHDGIGRHLAALTDFVEEHRALPRKDFAQKLMATFDKRLTGAGFAMLDGADGRAVLIEHLRRATQSDTRVEAMRDLYEFEWSTEGLTLPEAG